MTSAGRRPSEISGLPDGVPPSTDGSTFPRTSEATAARRVTVWPEPGTNSPTAPRPAYACGSNGGTTTTLTSAARAGPASGGESTAATRRRLTVSRFWTSSLRAVLVERSMHPGYLSNAYLVADEEGGTAVFVDSGAPIEPLLAAAERWRVTPVAVLRTHGHHDHVEHEDELGLPGRHRRLRVRRAPVPRRCRRPGHSDDGVSFHGGGVCFTGDTLFKDAVGGTRDDFEAVRRSVMDVLMKLPPETRVLPGHTEETTIGREWEENPFVRVWRGVDPEGTEAGSGRRRGRGARRLVAGLRRQGQGLGALRRRPRRDRRRLARRARLGDDRGLQVVARRVGEQRGDAVQPDPVRDQPLPRVRAAREERERRAHGRRRVVERAAQGQLLVVEAVRVDARPPSLAGRPPKKTTVPPGRTSASASRQACSVPAASITTSAGSAAGLRAEQRRQLAPLGAAADEERPPARVRDAGGEHQPDRAGAEDRDRVAGLDPGPLATPCRQQASGSTSAATSGARPGGTGRRLRRAIRSGTRISSA